MTDQANPYQAPSADVSVPLSGGEDQTGPFSPKGRFGRLSYLAWGLLTSLVFGFLVFIVAGGAAVFTDPTTMAAAGGPVVILIQVISIIPAIIFAIRRLHDFNASGWWAIAMVIPFANLILALFLLFKGGDEGTNRFGPARVTRGWEKVLGYIAIGFAVLGIVLVIFGGLMGAFA
ncbi:DUF805 domain-containing protein [Thiosocius teredinicola]|uniref:DUF805 domain-containing protein n=1 Tax=Thiosocius teredinicola TaxID=1973002 RepID=UPI0009913C5E